MTVAPKEPKEAPAAPAATAADAGPGPAPEKAGRKEKPGKGKEPKEAKESKGKSKPGAPGKTTKIIPDNPNFRYIVRVANTDLDGTRPTALALTGVRGVGLRISEVACRIAQVNASEMIGNLPETTVEALESTLGSLATQMPPWMVNHPHEPFLGESPHFFGPDL